MRRITPKNIKLREHRQKTLGAVFHAIVRTFPFRSRKEYLSVSRRYRTYRKRIERIPDDKSFFELIEHFVSSIHNSHTRVKEYPGKKIFLPVGYKVICWQNTFFLVGRRRNYGRIISIDGVSPRDKIRMFSKRLSYSTKQYFLFRVARLLPGSLEPGPARIDVEKRGQRTFVRLPRVKSSKPSGRVHVTRKILKPGIGYVKIVFWKGGGLQDELSKTVQWLHKAKVKGIIIDVRGNGGGDSRNVDRFSGHFLNRKTAFCAVQKRVAAPTSRFRSRTFFVRPRRPYLPQPLVLLVDAGSLSSTEYFVAGLHDAGRALVVGQPTGGGSGKPKQFRIPYLHSHFELLISTWLNYRMNGKPIEGKGITPTIIVKPTRRETISQTDVARTVAIRELQKVMAKS